jgi:hypothetical protein
MGVDLVWDVVEGELPVLLTTLGRMLRKSDPSQGDGIMAIPDYQTLMLPVLRRLAKHGWKTVDLVNALADEYSLNADERNALLPRGHTGGHL